MIYSALWTKHDIDIEVNAEMISCSQGSYIVAKQEEK